jgi:hypothetical protein
LLVDRLILLTLRLPSLATEQAKATLGPVADGYLPQLERVISHQLGRSLGGGCNDWIAVFDETATLALNALADMIDLRLGASSKVAVGVSDLVTTVEELIQQIRDAEDLDDESRSYLLEFSFHLLQVLQRIDIFGVDGVVELQGQFVAGLMHTHPDLVPPGHSSSDSEQTLVERLWEAMNKAVVVTGLPANAYAITELTRLALGQGN